VFGFLHLRKAHTDSSRPAAESAHISAHRSSDPRERARALCSEAAVVNDDGAEGDATQNDHRRCHRCDGARSDDREGDDDSCVDGTYELPVRASRRWDPLDDKRLLA